jgi:GNAT superfamily N-acetyltransferase
VAVSIELATCATDEVRELVSELAAELAVEYAPEQQHGLPLEAIFQPHIRFFVARSNGVAAGCGGVALCPDYAEVKRMYVRPLARGTDVAASLLARIEAEARGAGRSVLRLETGDRQLRAIRFYERSGFHRRAVFGEYVTMTPNAIATSLFYEKDLSFEAREVGGDGELEEILALQRANLARSVSAEEIATEGFVTVEHSIDVLRRMHAVRPSIVAKEGDRLAGYALVMPVECRSFVPILEPMFDRLATHGIERQRFYVMGQICVAKPRRGRGIFDLLYRTHRRLLMNAYDFVITEVATRNARSLRAHQRTGFEIIDRYRDETDEWALLRWTWR